MDLRTLFILTVLINIIIAFIMAIYWRTQKTYAGFGYWTLANVAMTVTFSLFALKGIAPEFVTVVIANTSAVSGAFFRYAGVRFFWGAESLPHVRFHQAVVAVCALLLTYYTCIDDNIVLRLFAVSLIISGYFLATARNMIKGATQGYPYEAWTLALLNLVYATLMMGRAFEWLIFPEARHLLIASSMSTLYFSSILLLEVTTALLFLMLNSQRLAKNLLQMQGDLEKLAASDMLTGLYNRRKLEEVCTSSPHARTGPQSSQRLAVDRPGPPETDERHFRSPRRRCPAQHGGKDHPFAVARPGHPWAVRWRRICRGIASYAGRCCQNLRRPDSTIGAMSTVPLGGPGNGDEHQRRSRRPQRCRLQLAGLAETG